MYRKKGVWEVGEMRSKHSWVFVASLVMLFLLTFAVSGRAQVLYGSLTGNVTDPSGAAVPNANVQALDVARNILHETTTDGDGVYRFPELLMSTYKVTVSMTNFATAEVNDVHVAINSVRRVDVQLKVATAVEKVVVTGAPPELQTDRADVHTDLQARQIEDLPILTSAGRNVQALFKLVPGFGMVTEGVSSDGGNPQRTMTGNVNGFSMQANVTRIDGSLNTYMWLPFNSAYVPPAEGIQTVNVVTNSYDAEQGTSGGANTSILTKSGTNGLHGSAFEYHTDDKLKALNAFQTVGTTKPKVVFNQYGGSIGGPIKKNKLFFFGDWEGTKRRLAASAPKTVINPAGIFVGGNINGNVDLSAAIPAGTDCNATPVAGCIFDPTTGNAAGDGRTAFPGNIIPAARISSAAKTMLGRITAANFIAGVPQGATANSNYLAGGALEMNRDTVDGKVDYVPSDRFKVFGRYSISMTKYFDPPALGLAMGGASGGGQVGIAPGRTQNVGLGGSYTLSPRAVIDINAGYTRMRLGAQYDPDLNLGTFGVTTLGIPGTNGTQFLQMGTPAFIVTNWNSMGNSDTGNPFLFRDNQYVANSNLSWIRGAHDMRFGIEYTRNGMNHFQPQGGAFQTPRGSFRFTGDVTALHLGPATNKTNSLAQFLLGLPNEVGKAVQNVNPNSLRWSTWSLYARDRWQITSKLTLTYGLRWEFYPMATADHGGVKLFDPTTGNVLIGGNGSVPLDDGVKVGAGSFLPRLGLAYRFTNKTVVRVGYGISADANNWRFFRNNYPATTNSDVNAGSSFAPAASLTAGDITPALLAVFPGLTAGIPTVALPDISSGIIPLPNNVGVGGATVPFNFHRGYVHTYNLSVQREIAGFVAEVAYIGTRGIHMLTNENINAGPIGSAASCDVPAHANPCSNANPTLLTTRVLWPVANRNWGDLNALAQDKPSYYDALQTKLMRRFSGGSSIGVVYTFSKAINYDDNEEVSGTFGVNGGFLFWAYPAYQERNKAVASFDRTHNLHFFGLYELPFGRGKRWAQHGAASAIAGGWQFNWVLDRLSGNPLTLTAPAGNLNAPGNLQTPDQIAFLQILGNVGPQPGTPGHATCALTDMTCHYFNPLSFATPPSTRFGNVGRNTVRGPGFFNLDISLFRDFRITERLKFQVRTEAFGVTNTPHLNNPNTDISNVNFGVITGTLNLAGRGSGTGGERVLYFAGKFTF